MASQFSALSQSSLDALSSFVHVILDGNAALVSTILDMQKASGYNRTEQVKASMAQTIDVLVNYIAILSAQFQPQMNMLMDTFDGLMDSVVAQFKNLETVYVAQIRLDSAAKGLASLAALMNTHSTAMQTVQQLLDIGLLDLSRLPSDPVGVADCALLAVLCSSSAAFYGSPLTLTSATGRFYKCSRQEGALVSVRNVSGGLYNESYLHWWPSPSAGPMRKRCLTEKPTAEVVGIGCSLSQTCRCGADQRCTPWYRQFGNATTSYFESSVYTDSSGIVAVHSTLALVSAAAPPAFLGLVDAAFPLNLMRVLVPTVQGLTGQAYTALFLNDTNLSAYGAYARPCAPNTPRPGNPSLPYYSGYRSCDPGLRAVAQWLTTNRSLAGTVTLDIDGILWDVSPLTTPLTSCLQVTVEVAADGAAAKAYIDAIGQQNLQAAQAMQDRFLAEIDALQ
eukprot:EG_transcript_12803